AGGRAAALVLSVRQVLPRLLVGLVLLAGFGLEAARDDAPRLLRRELSGGVEYLDLAYRSGPLTVRALACRAPAREGLPVLLYEHGGFEGITGREFCAEAAAAGFAVGISAFRGQGGSDGTPEACLGEVDDALALLPALARVLGADTSRVLHAGVSLGGCVALHAAAHDPHALGAAVFGPTTDFAARLDLLRAQGRLEAAARWEAYLGVRPDRLQVRDPLAAAAGIAGPLLIVHGGNDAQTPLVHSCRLRDARVAAGRAVVNSLIGRDGAAWAGPPVSQPCQGLTAGRAVPASWGGSDHFIVLRDLEHSTTPLVRKHMISFLKARLAPPR
ncbi:MAG TPA: CocE/NonD family hydrolase, partial [Deinococcales bacterium]|nr:CocE/NonD family hydrolase [Deinococcales bacterium]